MQTVPSKEKLDGLLRVVVVGVDLVGPDFCREGVCFLGPSAQERKNHSRSSYKNVVDAALT